MNPFEYRRNELNVLHASIEGVLTSRQLDLWLRMNRTYRGRFELILSPALGSVPLFVQRWASLGLSIVAQCEREEASHVA